MPRIMVVDDDANIRAILKYRFEREQYVVQLANNGLDALEQLRDRQPDLIVLDLMMPEMDGIEFLTELRDNPQTQGIPVIVLTALGSIPYSEKTRELGAVGLVTKPFSPRQLVEQAKRALNGCRPGSERRGNPSFGDHERYSHGGTVPPLHAEHLHA